MLLDALQKLSTLQQAKTLGGVGSILVILSIIPIAGAILGIVGFILILIAVKYISDSVGNNSIFNNMLISVILAIVGIVVAFTLVFATVASYMGFGFMQGGFTAPYTPPEFPPADLFAFVGTIIAGLLLLWVFSLVSAVFLRRSYNKIAASLGVGMFRTTSLLYLIGAALTIVLVGFIVIFVAEILQIVAFFSISERPLQPAPPPQTPMTPTTPSVIPPSQAS